jgi:hypothetical protein
VLDVLLVKKMDEMKMVCLMRGARMKMRGARKDDHYLVALVDHYYVDALPLLTPSYFITNFLYINFFFSMRNKKGALINKRPFL